MNPHRWSGLFAAALLLATMPVPAQEVEDEVEVTTFTPPQPDERSAPTYPSGPLTRGEEGAVEINFMVDKEGKPFELTITNVMGDEDFGQAALRAVERWTYTPAMIGNEPTVGSMRMVMRFTLEDEGGASAAGGASSRFIRTYRDFLSALKTEPREAAEEASARLEELTRNHYENAYVNLARYLYAEKYGTPLEQMQFLHAALSFSRALTDTSYLPDDERRNARRELFRLQVTNQYFREAMDTFLLIEAAGDTEAVESLRPAYAQLQILESDDTAYGIPITLDEDGAWDMKLLKHNVYIQQVVGAVNEFKVRCTQQYVGFAVEPDVSYNLPTAWGTCDLEILGEAGSTFTLVQH